MDEQFGGRTDDDLFADDFEPIQHVEPAATVSSTPAQASVSQPQPTATVTASTTEQTAPQPPAATAQPFTPPKGPANSTSRRNRQPKQKAPKPVNGEPHGNSNGAPKQSSAAVTTAPATTMSAAQAPEHTVVPPPSLAQSRHNRPPSTNPQSAADSSAATIPSAPGTQGATPSAPTKSRRGHGGEKNENNKRGGGAKQNGRKDTSKDTGKDSDKASPAPVQKDGATTASLSKDDPSAPAKTTPPTAPTGPKAATKSPAVATGTRNGSGKVSKDPAIAAAGTHPNMRTQSGANPRTRLTEAELEAKMSAMRLASEEKTRRFEQAQRDERDHDMALARGREEAARRRKAVAAAEDEKRRRGEEDRRKLEEERARNRDRKLKAMGAKEGNWDEGKGDGGGGGGMRASRHAAPQVATVAGVLPIANASTATAKSEPGSSKNNNNNAGGGRGSGRNGRNGRGGGGGGRGGRGGRIQFNDAGSIGADVAVWVQGQPDPSSMTPPSVLGQLEREFPALPGSTAPTDTKDESKPKATPVKNPLPRLQPLSPGIGTWAEEVAAMDEALQNGQA